MKIKTMLATGALAGALAFSSVAGAAVIGPDAGGFGFVGKGDVQLAYADTYKTNNQWLQGVAADVDFRVASTTVTSWTCSKPNPSDPEKPDIVNLRSTETTTQGLVTTVARENSKGKDGPVSGFNLNGWEGTPTVVTDGDVLGSCPANPSGFTYDEGSEQTSEPTGSGVEVTIDGNSWRPIA